MLGSDGQVSSGKFEVQKSIGKFHTNATWLEMRGSGSSLTVNSQLLLVSDGSIFSSAEPSLYTTESDRDRGQCTIGNGLVTDRHD